MWKFDKDVNNIKFDFTLKKDKPHIFLLKKITELIK